MKQPSITSNELESYKNKMYQEEFDNLIKKMRTRNEKDNMSKLREELDNVLVKYWGVKK